MKEKILRALEEHSNGLRRREIASIIKVWQCNSEFLKTMNELKEERKIKEISYSDPANMEYYYIYKIA